MARKLKRHGLVINAWTEEGVTYIIEQTGAPPRVIQRTDPILFKLQEIESQTTKIDEKEKEQKPELNSPPLKCKENKNPTESLESSSNENSEFEISNKKLKKKKTKRQPKTSNQDDE